MCGPTTSPRPWSGRRSAQVPALDPGPRRGPAARLRHAGRRAGHEHGPDRRRAARPRRRAGHHGQPVLLVVAADHADGLPRDQGRRGRRVRLGGRRVRSAGRPCGNSDYIPGASLENPLFGDAVARTAPPGRAASDDVGRPARERPAPRRLHRDGPDRRERRGAHGHHPPRAGRVRRPVARTAPRRRWPTASGPTRSRRSPCPTARSCPPTTARVPASPSSRCRP